MKISVHEAREVLRRENFQWQRAALGLMILSTIVNLIQCAAIWTANLAAAEWEQRYYTAASLERDAVQAYGELLGQVEAERAAREAQTAAYESLSGYQYIGECTITAYCPCEECCGQWADGLTATGIPAVPGIVAVDPEVIPIGYTVVIDGQQYLAADTGVTGIHVDIAVLTHEEAVECGIRTADVWIVALEGGEQDG